MQTPVDAERELVTIPGSRGLENICPVVRIKEFCAKLRRKIGVFKARRVVFLHELNFCCSFFGLPPVPEPLTVLTKARDREYPPVYENPDFSLVEPLRQRSGIQTSPVGRVPRCASRCHHQKGKCTYHTENTCRPDSKWHDNSRVNCPD